MKKIITLLLVFYIFLTLTSCANSKPPSELETTQEQTTTESPMTSAPPTESIEFFGETYLIEDADYIDCDVDGNVKFVLFHNIGFVGLADGNEEPLYQQVKVGQAIGGAIVAEGTSMGFDFINGKWELTESDVRFTGHMKFIGELTKTPEGDEFLAPGTLEFTAIDSESGFMPFKYGYDNAPELTLSGYNPEVDFPELFAESDTVYVKATLDWLRLFKTERATGMNYATLVSVELFDFVQKLVDSVAFDSQTGNLSFTIPNEISDEYTIYIRVSGRIKMGDGSMSFHAFEEESENNSWKLGKTYTYEIGKDALLEGIIDVGLIQNDNKELRCNKLVAIDENGTVLLG